MLVGGAGTRLRPLTLTTPKPLLPIAGRPFVERQLQWLAAHGVDEVVLSLGYLPEAFIEHFPEGRFGSLALKYAVEEEPMGTAGAIRFAAELAGIDDTFVVCNGDVLTTLDLSAFVAFHREHEASATIQLSRIDDPSAFGVVPTYPDGEVKEFVEKPVPGAAPTNWINAGTYVLEPEVLDGIPPAQAVSIERETFPQLLEDRGRLYAMGTDDYWIDIGTPEMYLRAHVDVVAGCLGAPPVPDAEERAPGVWIEANVDLASDVVLEAPLLIGAGSAIGSGGRLAGATLGPRCTAGPGVVIDGSVVLAGAQLGSKARVIASIVGPNACIGDRASVLDHSIVGASAGVDAGDTVAGGRVSLAATG